MTYKQMEEADIRRVIPLYVAYYNGKEGCAWTVEKAYKWIHQVWSMEDAYCLLAQEEGEAVGFAMGYFHQYDDLVAYDLMEIVINAEHRGKGLGTQLLQELEKRVQAMGASVVQLQAVNDEMHHHFYGKLGYGNAGNLISKVKWLA